MDQTRHALYQLIAQLDYADACARAENPAQVPSTWQMTNQHLRGYALAALAGLSQPSNAAQARLEVYVAPPLPEAPPQGVRLLNSFLGNDRTGAHYGGS